MMSEQPTATQVGYTFVSKYYTTLIQEPASLYKFYKEESQLIHRTGLHDDEEKIATGLKDIKSKINSLVNEEGAKVKLTIVDSQRSLHDSVFVCVEGLISFTPSEPLKRFTQSFLLASQKPTGYFVFNDVFRFVSTAPISTPDASSTWTGPSTTQNLITNNQPPRHHHQTSSTSSRQLDSDDISEAGSTAATIGTSSVTGIDENISQMMKDVDETGALSQSLSQQNLNELNGDESEEERELSDSEEERGSGSRKKEEAPTEPAKGTHTQATQESAPNKTYSSWSQVVGGDEYAAPPPKPQSERKQRPPRTGRGSSKRGENDQQAAQSSSGVTQKEFNRRPEKFAVYVSKIQQEVSDQDLRDAFGSFGEIVDLLNKSTGDGGYALVFYGNRETVDQVVQNHKGKIQVKGHTVHVDKHHRKPSSPFQQNTRGRSDQRGRGTFRGRGRGEWNSNPSPRGERGERSERSERGRGRGFGGRSRGTPVVTNTEQ
jgi:hypothetical protein